MNSSNIFYWNRNKCYNFTDTIDLPNPLTAIPENDTERQCLISIGTRTTTNPIKIATGSALITIGGKVIKSIELYFSCGQLVNGNTTVIHVNGVCFVKDERSLQLQVPVYSKWIVSWWWIHHCFTGLHLWAKCLYSLLDKMHLQKMNCDELWKL